MAFLADIQKLMRRNRFIGYGIPFMVILVGGSLALKQFAQLRYTFRKKRLLSPEEAEASGVKMKPQDERLTIEKEYEKIQNMDLDSWVNVRGPRPWEPSENTDVNEQKRT